MTRASKTSGDGGKASNTPQGTHPIAEKAPRTRASTGANMVGKNPADMIPSDSIPGDEVVGGNDDDGSVSGSRDMDSTVMEIPSTQPTQSQVNKSRGQGKNPKKPQVWTPKKEEKLIEMYKERVFMFNMSEKGYHNRNKKAAALKYMATQLGVTGT